jgi:hypothetical protein
MPYVSQVPASTLDKPTGQARTIIRGRQPS